MNKKKKKSLTSDFFLLPSSSLTSYIFLLTSALRHLYRFNNSYPLQCDRHIMAEVTFSFEDLRVYRTVRELIKNIYLLQNRFPKEERYALGDQVRRAATSITANIAEGSGRQSVKEKIHFIEIAFGSMTEVFCELQTACDLDYITESQFNELRPHFTNVAKMLSGLRTSLQKQL